MSFLAAAPTLRYGAAADGQSAFATPTVSNVNEKGPSAPTGRRAFPTWGWRVTVAAMKARCQCGALQAHISGEGDGVMCHCKACQRRSGSPFGMMIYYDVDAVELSGTATEYTRLADSGDKLTHGFCPTCGTPFYLSTARHPGGIGISVGAHEGSDSLPPVRSVFEESRHPWVEVPSSSQNFPRGRKG